jgi:hypothetical protein
MLRSRIGLLLATAAVGVVGALGLAACGPAEADTVTASLSTEGQALAAMGFSPADLAAEPGQAPAADPTPSASASADGKRHARAARVFLRKHVLHGEATVETKDGVKTVDVQRGTITAFDGKTLTVKSKDGFTLTWTVDGQTHVVQHKTAVQPSALKVGGEVGVAGTKDGGTTTAKLVVIPEK